MYGRGNGWPTDIEATTSNLPICGTYRARQDIKDPLCHPLHPDYYSRRLDHILPLDNKESGRESEDDDAQLSSSLKSNPCVLE